VLVVRGDNDAIVPVTLGERLYGLTQAPKRFVRVAGAGHNDLGDDAVAAAKQREAFVHHAEEPRDHHSGSLHSLSDHPEPTNFANSEDIYANSNIPNIPGALQSCASPNFYYTANTASDITSALIAQAVSTRPRYAIAHEFD
jgi:hypothetical protein